MSTWVISMTRSQIIYDLIHECCKSDLAIVPYKINTSRTIEFSCTQKYLTCTYQCYFLFSVVFRYHLSCNSQQKKVQNKHKQNNVYSGPSCLVCLVWYFKINISQNKCNAVHNLPLLILRGNWRTQMYLDIWLFLHHWYTHGHCHSKSIWTALSHSKTNSVIITLVESIKQSPICHKAGWF